MQNCFIMSISGIQNFFGLVKIPRRQNSKKKTKKNKYNRTESNQQRKWERALSKKKKFTLRTFYIDEETSIVFCRFVLFHHTITHTQQLASSYAQQTSAAYTHILTTRQTIKLFLFFLSNILFRKSVGFHQF